MWLKIELRSCRGCCQPARCDRGGAPNVLASASAANQIRNATGLQELTRNWQGDLLKSAQGTQRVLDEIGQQQRNALTAQQNAAGLAWGAVTAADLAGDWQRELFESAQGTQRMLDEIRREHIGQFARLRADPRASGSTGFVDAAVELAMDPRSLSRLLNYG